MIYDKEAILENSNAIDVADAIGMAPLCIRIVFLVNIMNHTWHTTSFLVQVVFVTHVEKDMTL